MCGIVGAMALGKLTERPERLRQESMIFLTTELLQLTQARGTDATGTSILFNDGNFVGLKMGISSPEFISRFGGSKTDFEGFLKIWRGNEQPVKTYLGHCRKTSIGSSVDNNNNHPIKIGNIVGVHNGTLTNHEVIFQRLGCKRDGDVDSEAIVRLLNFYSKKGSIPFTVEMLKEVCLRLQGTYSVVAYNADSPNQMVTFRDGKPAVVALIRSLNLLLVASEDNYIKQALYRYNKHTKLYRPRIKFPMLRKEDIDIKTMPDDTCAVFDLSEKVEKDTDVGDLFESAKVLRADKIWKKGTTYTRNTHNYNKNVNQHKPVVDEGTTADKNTNTNGDTSSNTKTESKQDIRKAKVWNKDLREFDDIDPTDEEKAKKIRSIELSVDGSMTHVGTNKVEKLTDSSFTKDDKETEDDKLAKGSIILEKVPKEKVNDLVGNTAKIHDEPVDYDEDARTSDDQSPFVETVDIINPSTGETNKAKKTLVGTTVEVNTNVNAAAMEAAAKAASVHPKFESDDEVLEELEIDDLTKLKSLQLFALTNRISKVIFKKAFYKGFVRGQNINDKIGKAENNIITLKTVVKIFMKALQNTKCNKVWKKNYIKKASESEKELTIDDIRKVFSAGDFRDNEELKYLKDECTKK